MNESGENGFLGGHSHEIFVLRGARTTYMPTQPGMFYNFVLPSTVIFGIVAGIHGIHPRWPQ